MKYAIRLGTIGAVLTWMMASTGCVVSEHPEGYYDNGHHRYWHEHNWHECGERDEHCR